MGTKNFQVEDKTSGKKYWISRSMATAVVILTEDGKFMAERRGPGCPDNVGKLAFPCGYLDFGETLEECARREVWEELGLEVEELYFVGINDIPEKDARQNVTVRFLARVKGTPDINSISRGGESEEVSEVVTMTLGEILENREEWAFGHDELAEHVTKNMMRILNPIMKYV